MKDLKNAGQCLAFEVWTASAFHLMRACEKVLREWHQRGVPNPTPNADWALRTKELTDAGADQATVDSLDQIRRNYRNPTMHPQTFYERPQALALFGSVLGAITNMAEQIKKLPAPSSTAPTQPSGQSPAAAQT